MCTGIYAVIYVFLISVKNIETLLTSRAFNMGGFLWVEHLWGFPTVPGVHLHITLRMMTQICKTLPVLCVCAIIYTLVTKLGILKVVWEEKHSYKFYATYT